MQSLLFSVPAVMQEGSSTGSIELGDFRHDHLLSVVVISRLRTLHLNSLAMCQL